MEAHEIHDLWKEDACIGASGPDDDICSRRIFASTENEYVTGFVIVNNNPSHGSGRVLNENPTVPAAMKLDAEFLDRRQVVAMHRVEALEVFFFEVGNRSGERNVSNGTRL
ncbi:hypothetical protein [Methylocystis parvus]|uniref:hypothetical protein n=1 Tax=Methylocystis parvus TaxID=134 RepID=UPI003C78973B